MVCRCWELTNCFVICDPGSGKYFKVADVIIPINIIEGTIGFHIVFSLQNHVEYIKGCYHWLAQDLEASLCPSVGDN